jgi:hypothetical protein
MVLPVPRRDGKSRTALRHLDLDTSLHGEGTSCVRRLSEIPINPYSNEQVKALQPDHNVHYRQEARLQRPEYRKGRQLLTRKLFAHLLEPAVINRRLSRYSKPSLLSEMPLPVVCA